jgi:outer membrane protein, heavy metal efflux system
MRTYAILPLALLGAAPAVLGAPQSPPSAGVVLTQQPAERPAGRGLFSRLKGSKTSVPAPPAADRPVAARPKPSRDVAKSTAPTDAPVRRTQGTPGDIPSPLPPGATMPTGPADAIAAEAASQPIALGAALYGAITSNPDLVALRGGNQASAEAVEVARRFPTTLNPTLWVDVRPLAYERVPGMNTPHGRVGPSLDQKDALMYFSLRQPIELGHQTTHRYHIAKAAYSQQQWTVVQAELTALVQTYRLFQTAAYRREKLRVARELAEFNDKLVAELPRRLKASQIKAADVALAEVEAETTRQLVEAARQDYANALADLQNQLGVPEAAAVEPLGEFVLPGPIPNVEDQELVVLALQNRPDLHAARAVVQGAKAAVCLAKGDRIPTPVVGPVYERDEQGTQFFGFVYITPIPVLNNGQPLVRQREAELRSAAVRAQQIEQRIAAQVKASVAKWNAAVRTVRLTESVPDAVRSRITTLEQLFDIQEADITKLQQGRLRLIQVENARLDALWQATQAQADLLAAVGTPSMITALQAGPRAPQSTSANSAAPVPPAASAPGGR